MRWRFFQEEGISRTWFLSAFLLKVLGGIALILVYTYYYTDPAKADIYRYFNDSLTISRTLWSDPMAWLRIMTGIGIHDPTAFQYLVSTEYFSQPLHDFVTDNTFIIRVHVLLNYISIQNIYINTLWMNFFGFLGLTALLKSLSVLFRPNTKVLLFPLFFIPSLIFWGSGPLKEQLIYACLGFYVLVLSESFRLHVAVRLLLAALFLAIIYQIKPHAAVFLLMSSVFLPIVNLYDIKRFIGVGFALGLSLIAAYSFGWLSHICELLLTKRNEFIGLALQEHSGSLLSHLPSGISCTDLWHILPGSFAQALLGPYFWANASLFNGAFSLENTLLIIGLIYLLIRFFKFPVNRHRQLMFFFCLSFALLNYLLIGITVPVVGAIVHYRILATPFLGLAVLLITDEQQIHFMKKPR